MNRVQTVTQKQYRVEKLGRKPTQVHEHQNWPSWAHPGAHRHAQARARLAVSWPQRRLVVGANRPCRRRSCCVAALVPRSVARLPHPPTASPCARALARPTRPLAPFASRPALCRSALAAVSQALLRAAGRVVGADCAPSCRVLGCLTIHPCLKPSSGHNTLRYIVIQKLSSLSSLCHNTAGILQYNIPTAHLSCNTLPLLQYSLPTYLQYNLAFLLQYTWD